MIRNLSRLKCVGQAGAGNEHKVVHLESVSDMHWGKHAKRPVARMFLACVCEKTLRPCVTRSHVLRFLWRVKDAQLTANVQLLIPVLPLAITASQVAVR